MANSSMPLKSGFPSIRNSQCVIRNRFLHILSELVKESDSGFQIANDELINAFEIRLSIHSQFAMCHPESIPSHPLRVPTVSRPRCGPRRRRASKTAFPRGSVGTRFKTFVLFGLWLIQRYWPQPGFFRLKAGLQPLTSKNARPLFISLRACHRRPVRRPVLDRNQPSIRPCMWPFGIKPQ